MTRKLFRVNREDWSIDDLNKPYFLVFTKYECYIAKMGALLVLLIAALVFFGSLVVTNSFDTMVPAGI